MTFNSALNFAHDRVAVGMALVRFFADVRGRPLSPEEHAEAAYAGDDFIFRDQRERAFWRDMEAL